MSKILSNALRIVLVIGVVLVGVIYASTKAHALPHEPSWLFQLNPCRTLIGISQPNLIIPPPNEVVIQTAEHDECLHCHILGSFRKFLGALHQVVRCRNCRHFRGIRHHPQRLGLAKSIRLGPGHHHVSATGLTNATSTKEALNKFLKKPVPNWATRWWYCLGGITAFLFIIQAITGVMLAFYYQPTPEHAYASIQYIENEVLFGASIRAIHHWSANGMIIMCTAHMLRVFIMGAFKAPRELNWVSGVILMITTLGFGFTGYLLPWDQRAFWATTVGTEIAGGIPDIGTAGPDLPPGWLGDH